MEFADLGTRCDFKGCGVQDFLPFPCASCSAKHCLEHASPILHKCAGASARDHRVVACPLCARGIDLVEGRDVHILFAEHEASRTCRDAVAARRAAQGGPKCAHKPCGKSLMSGLSTVCKGCGRAFCLSHRYEDQHSCKGHASGSSLLSGVKAAVSQAMVGGVAAKHSHAKHPPAPKQKAPPIAAAAAAAAPAAPPRAATHNGPARGGSASSGAAAAPRPVAGHLLRETAHRRTGVVCPRCALRFADDAALAVHGGACSGPVARGIANSACAVA